MNTAKIYYDSEDNECTINQMVRREPEWAANIIQWYEAEIAKLKANPVETVVRKQIAGWIKLENELPPADKWIILYSNKREERTYSTAYIHKIELLADPNLKMLKQRYRYWQLLDEIVLGNLSA